MTSGLRKVIENIVNNLEKKKKRIIIMIIHLVYFQLSLFLLYFASDDIRPTHSIWLGENPSHA